MKPLRYVLRSGAIVFGLSGIALLLAPSYFVELLGLESTNPLAWSMVMMGVTVVALSGNMAVVSFSGSDSGVFIASIVMLFSAASLGIVTLLIPVTYTWFTLTYAGIGGGFMVAYAVGLLRVGLAR